jgi:hypothetical protein
MDFTPKPVRPSVCPISFFRFKFAKIPQHKLMKSKYYLLVPIFGICLFVILFFASTFLYPGGNQLDKNLKGFSFLNNYWCDLLSIEAKNGQPNLARPLAISAWVMLCFTLSFFWQRIPGFLCIPDMMKKTIRICGITTMAVAALMFTQMHNIVIHISALTGCLASLATFIGLFKTRLYNFFYFGLISFILMGMNYCMMVFGVFISYLPLIQKITFTVILMCICFICQSLYKMQMAVKSID